LTGGNTSVQAWGFAFASLGLGGALSPLAVYISSRRRAESAGRHPA